MLFTSSETSSRGRLAARLQLWLLVFAAFAGGLATAHLLPGVLQAQEPGGSGTVEELGIRWDSDGQSILLTSEDGESIFLALAVSKTPESTVELTHSAWMTPSTSTAKVPVPPDGAIYGIQLTGMFVCDPRECRFCNPDFSLCPFPPKPEPFPDGGPGSGQGGGQPWP